MTPDLILNPAKRLLVLDEYTNQIDLDPASSAQANRRVNAGVYFSSRKDGLKQSWSKLFHRPYSVWLNPPGGWHNGQYGDSEMKYWWRKLLEQRAQGFPFGHALFLSFSIEAQQTTQLDCARSILSFPTCVFERRVKFIDPLTGKEAIQNTHASCLTYLPGAIDRSELFASLFAKLGLILKQWELK